MFEAVGHTLNLARAYHFISWVHLYEHRLPDALDAIEEHGSMRIDRQSKFFKCPSP